MENKRIEQHGGFSKQDTNARANIPYVKNIPPTLSNDGSRNMIAKQTIREQIRPLIQRTRNNT